MLIQVHSTRLFPKNHGASAYEISGIASKCDWVILSDNRPPHTSLVKRNRINEPQYIFLSLRSPFRALSFFTKDVMPHIKEPFVLITGSEDITIPIQTDLRWRAYNYDECSYIMDILGNQLLRHWFAENLVCTKYPKMSPLPTGMVFPKAPRNDVIRIPNVPRLGERDFRVLCAHRIIKGSQWLNREKVTELSHTKWAHFCTLINREITEYDYTRQIEKHCFVLCVEGGGIDPSPKAWQAILHGAIPIIRKNALSKAYQQLPVAFISDWKEECINEQILQDWFRRLIYYYDNNMARDEVIRRLGIEYWWSRISAAPL